MKLELWNLKSGLKPAFTEANDQIPDDLTLFSHFYDHNIGNGGSGLDDRFTWKVC